MIYRSGNLTLDTRLYRLFRRDEQIDIEPQVFDLLIYLIENRDRLVTRDELLDTLWKGRVVSDSALSARMKAARKAVGDSGRAQDVIKTVHGRGYQFVADLTERADDSAPKVGASASRSGVPTLRIESFGCLPEEGELLTFAEELHDQIAVRLSRRTGMRLLQDTTSQKVLSTTPDYLLSGRIRYLASKCSVTLTMVWCDTGENVWTRAFSGKGSDPLQMVDDIADTVDAALRYQIPAFDARRFGSQDESQLSPDELLTKAAEYFSRVSLEDLHHAIALIARAMAVHPDNAMALAMWVDATVHLGCVVPEHQGENGDESLARMAERAVELNPHSDYVFCARASLRLMRLGDSSGALEDGRRSVELSPNFSWGFSIMGQALVCLGRADEAIELLHRAESLSDSDPWKPYHSGVLALAQFLSGDLDGSLSNIDSLINLHPGVWTHHRLKAAILGQKKDMGGAERSRDHAMKYFGTPHILAYEFPLPARYHEMLRQ